MKRSSPIVIIGFMACGKTELARALARRLERPMVDLDELIAKKHGRTAAQLIREEGESAFRAIETKALHELLESGAQAVISLGGGAWISEANRRLIEQYGSISLWLDAPFDLCWQRIAASDDDRPLARKRAQAEELYQARQPIYRQARIRVPVVAHETIESIVARVENLLTNHP